MNSTSPPWRRPSVRALLCTWLLVCLGAHLHAAAPDIFSLGMEVSGGGLTEPRTLTIGMDATATDNYDSGLDAVLPPPPPSGYRVTLVGNGSFPNLGQDIRGPNAAGAIWRLKTDITEGTMVVTWGSQFDTYLTSRSLRLVPASGGVETNMKITPSVTLSTGGTQTYYIILDDGGNRAPVAVADTAVALGAATAPGSIDIPVLLNDSDPDDDALTIEWIGSPTPGGGTAVAINGARGIRYTPAAGVYAEDAFTYRITDGRSVVPLIATGTVTVQVDNPSSTTPRLAVADLALFESNSGQKAFQFTVTLSTASSLTVTVNYATADGTATLADADHAVTSGQVTFAPDVTSQTITVQVNGDAKVELDEFFLVNLFNPVNAAISDAQAAGTIRNDDLPTLSVADRTADEGNSGQKTFSFTIALSEVFTSTVTANYATADGTATVADDDYTAATGTLTYSPGQTAKTVNVSVKGDTKAEADDTFTLNLSNPVNATILDAQGMGTIRNDDLPALSIVDISANEGNGGQAFFAFLVTLNAPGSSTVTADFATADGTATVADGDYTPVGGQITFAPGETQKTINVAVNGDTAIEADEAFTVTLSNPVNAALSNAQATGTILDDDEPAEMPSITISDLAASEGNTGAFGLQFSVVLSQTSSSTVTVSYATSDGTATAGSDYTAANGQLTFAPGQTQQTLTVQVTGDTTSETDETFVVNLTNPVNATLSDAQGMGTIRNDDAATGDPGWTPPGGLLNTMTVHAVVRLGGASYVSAAGSKLAVFKNSDIRGVATIFNGPATEMQFQLSVGSNSSSETGLTLKVYDAASGAVLDIAEPVSFVADGTTGTVVSPQLYNAGTPPQPGASLSLSDASMNEGQNGQSALTFTVTLSAISTAMVQVDYATADGTATAGTDYTATSGQLTFAPGDTEKTVVVQVSGDTQAENDETFVVNLSNPINAPLADVQAIGTIRNDDASVPPPQVALSIDQAILAEAGATATFTVTLSAVAAQTVTVNLAFSGTGVNGVDYTRSGTQIAIAPGATTGSITVTVVQDMLDEPDETVIVDIDTVTNGTEAGTQQHTVTILDDDEPAGLPSITISDLAASEGNTGAFGLQFSVVLSQTSSSTVTVSYATSDGTATAGSDYTAANGQLTFAPGQTQQTLTVQVTGDTTIETDETFFVNLTNPVNATLSDAQGMGTVRNDDAATGDPGWTPPGGLLNTMTVHAVVRLGGASYVSAAGSKLAVFKNSDIRGVATIFNGPATEMQFQLSVGSNSSSESGLTLKVYDAASGAVLDIVETVDFVADDTLGTVVTPGTLNAGAPPLSGAALSIDDVTTDEGNSGQTTFTFTVTLSVASTATVTVDYATVDGTATAGTDYTATSGQLTFAPGDTAKTVVVQVSGDTQGENSETFTVNLASAVNAPLADAQAIGTIRNDDAGVLPALAIGDVSANEGNSGPTPFVFTVTLNAVSATAVTVNYGTANGTANAGSDYTAASGTLTFAAGETSKNVTVTVTGDTTAEADETFTVTLSSPSGATLATAQATGTIRNDDEVVLPTLTIGDSLVAEGAVATFQVTLNTAGAAAITVNYATADGTATVSTGDYAAASGLLTFAAGETSKTLAVTTSQDTAPERDETFTVTLSNPTGATLADAQAIGTILGDSPPWYPSFDLGTKGILMVTVRRENGPVVLESQAVDFAEGATRAFAAGDYRSGTGSGRMGLLPGGYSAQVSEWDQDRQLFNAPGPVLAVPLVTYAAAAAPTAAQMTSAQVTGASNRTWGLSFTGTVRAQGFVLEVKELTSGTLVYQLEQEFLPLQTGDPFPVSPASSELTRVYLGVGAFQWRLRFFTPIDPPELGDLADNWSGWASLTTLTETTLDLPRKPVAPPVSQRWYGPEPGAVFSASPDTQRAIIDFSWSPVSNADGYFFYLTTGEGRVIINRGLVMGSQWPGMPLDPGSYFWAICPTNTELGRDGIADEWLLPCPFFTVLPAVEDSSDLPGQVTVAGVTRGADGYLTLALTWNGRVAPAVRLLVLNPGVMLEPEQDRDASASSFTTYQLDTSLQPGDKTLIKAQGISATGVTGPWSSFVQIVIPAKP